MRLNPHASVVLLDRPFDDDAVVHNEILDLRNISSKTWRVALRARKAIELSLYHLTVTTVDGIEELGHVKRLFLNWAPKIVGLSPVFSMSALSALSIVDFPRLSELSGIEKLKNLRELNLSGNTGSGSPPLRLTSIQPISRLQQLEELSLTNARLADDDITPIARLPALRRLHLSNKFERAQFAYLAKRLNSQLETPIVASRTASGRCNACGAFKQMFIGKRGPFVGQLCEREKVSRLEKEFYDLVQSA